MNFLFYVVSYSSIWDGTLCSSEYMYLHILLLLILFWIIFVLCFNLPIRVNYGNSRKNNLPAFLKERPTFTVSEHVCRKISINKIVIQILLKMPVKEKSKPGGLKSTILHQTVWSILAVSCPGQMFILQWYSFTFNSKFHTFQLTKHNLESPKPFVFIQTFLHYSLINFY